MREDRCHLNVLAMENGQPAYVSAVSRSDTIDGWRDRRADGGVVIEVETGRIGAEVLSMPHSPRHHQRRLWMLTSGSGELGRIEERAKALRQLSQVLAQREEALVRMAAATLLVLRARYLGLRAASALAMSHQLEKVVRSSRR